MKRALLTLSVLMPLLGGMAAATAEPFTVHAMEIPELCVEEAPMSPVMLAPEEEKTTCAADACIDTYDHADGRESTTLPESPTPLPPARRLAFSEHVIDTDFKDAQDNAPPSVERGDLSTVRRE